MSGWLRSKFGLVFGRNGPMFGSKSCKCCKAICPRCAQRNLAQRGRFYNRINWQLGMICLCSPKGLTGTVAGITPTLTATGVPVVNRFGSPAYADLSVSTDPNGDYCMQVGTIWEPGIYHVHGFKCATGTITVGEETGTLYGYYDVGVIIFPDTSELPPGAHPNTADPGLFSIRVNEVIVGLTLFSDIASRVPNEPTLDGAFLLNTPGLKSDGGASTHYLGDSIGTVRAKLIAGRDGTSIDDWVWWERQNGWCAPSPNWASFSMGNDLTTVPANRLGGTGGTVTVSGPCRTDCGNTNAICLPGITAYCVEIFETTSSGSPAITTWADWTRTSGPTVVTISSGDASALPPPPWNTPTFGPKTGGGCTARYVRVRPANSTGGCDTLDPPAKLTYSTPCPYGGIINSCTCADMAEGCSAVRYVYDPEAMPQVQFDTGNNTLPCPADGTPCDSGWQPTGIEVGHGPTHYRTIYYCTDGQAPDEPVYP